MKRILCLIVGAALALSLSACSAEEVSTTKSDELKAQYSFYEKSVKEIRGKMNVSPEQADEIFLVLVNDCGLDGAIRSIYTTDKGATYSYYWEGSAKTQKMTVENGVVTEVRYLYEVLYPSEDVDNSEDSSETQEPSSEPESPIASEPETSEVESSAPSTPESTQAESSSTVSTPPQSSSTTTPSTPQYKPSVVYIAASGKGSKYHKSSKCSGMNGDVIAMTREEAEAAGYSPCKKNSCYG